MLSISPQPFGDITLDHPTFHPQHVGGHLAQVPRLALGCWGMGRILLHTQVLNTIHTSVNSSASHNWMTEGQLSNEAAIITRGCVATDGSTNMVKL